MSKEKELEKLHQKIKNCKKCPLWKLRKNAVPGEGPANAKIFICGQAPGVEEDKTGRPFVGRAGKFLNELLKIARIEREEVFITSPLKCLPQPPINRKPKKEEIKALVEKTN
jgi:DNA polymerase